MTYDASARAGPTEKEMAMNVKQIAAVIAIAAMGLAACSPDITPESSTAPSGPAVSSAPAQPAEEQKAAEAGPATVPVAQEEKKDEGVAPAVEAKVKEGEKKVD